MSKIRTEDSVILAADAEHPVSSRLSKDGTLEQQGISAEGLQREVGVSRSTKLGPDGKYQFCWRLDLYQHPGCRKEVPLGCGPRKEAPKLARQFARAFHEAAQAGYDPREASRKSYFASGAPRGYYWHRLVGSLLCGCSEIDPKRLRRYLKNEGYWQESVSPESMLEGLDRTRRSRRRG